MIIAMMDEVDTHHQHFLERLFASLLAVTFVIVAARLYSRFFITRNAMLDDYVAFVAWVFVSGQTSMDLVSSIYGVGRRVEDVDETKIFHIVNMLVTSQMLSTICLTLVRLSIVAFYRRLHDTKLYNHFLIAFATVIGLVGIVTTFLFSFQCRPAVNVWHRTTSSCINPRHEQNIIAAFCICGLMFDISLLMLPIWLVSIRMNSAKKAIRVALVFSSGVFVIAIDIIRVVILYRTMLSEDSTWDISLMLSWVALEEHIGLWAACFPAIFPLIRVTWDTLSSKNRTSNTGSYFFNTSIRRPKVRQQLDVESAGSLHSLQDLGGLCSNAEGIAGCGGDSGTGSAKGSVHVVDGTEKVG